MMNDSSPLLQAIDPAVLSVIAGQALRAPVIELGNWTVSPLSHEKVLETTGGLYCFEGHARTGEQNELWSAV